MSCKKKKLYKTYAEATNDKVDPKQKINFCGECWGFHLGDKP